MAASPDHDGPRPVPPRSEIPAGLGDGPALALGRLPSGLFVISWPDAGVDRTMLASWVMQAGFVPPAVSVAVAPSRDLLGAIDRDIPFVISILGESQRGLLSKFGKPTPPGEDPFAGLGILRAPGGGAALAAASGWIECRGMGRTAAGDHVVVVAEVVGGDCGSGEPPLVHVRKNGLRY